MHIYKTRLKILFRSKSLIFWTLIFPIVLGTLFSIAFSNLNASESFNPIKIGIVKDETYTEIPGFKTMINSLSTGKDKIFIVKYYDNESLVKKALEDNTISGYYDINKKIDVVVKVSGTNQTIMKYIIDSYYEDYSVINNVISFSGSNYKEEMLNELNSNTNYFTSSTVGNLDMTVLYFYSLIGMVCLYGGFFGVNAVNSSEANLSKKAARLSISPTNKLKNLLCALLAGYTVQLIEAVILLLYLIFILKVPFGSRIPYVLLMLVVGSLAGISMGTFIGVSNKKNENMKTGIVLSVTMACSFLAGLMVENLKYIIAEKAPILAKINPVSMITDGLYSLYYYDSLNRYFINIISLIIFSILMILGAFLFIRRKNMTVFKAYIKILKTFLPTIILYFSIFMFIAIMVGSLGGGNTSFTVTKPNVFIINNDNSKVVDTFIKYVKENAVIVNIDNDEESIKDALFYRQVDYVIEIPSNYGIDFISGKDVKIKTLSIPSSSNTTYAEMLFNKYFSVYKTYLNTGMDENSISKLVLNDLKSTTKVNLIDSTKKNIDKLTYYYNYTNYTILATSILIIGMIINTFTSNNIKKRNEVSSTSYKKINRLLFLCNALLSLIIWLGYVIISIVLYKNTMLTVNGLLFIINSLVFSIMALSLGFLIGHLVSSREAQSGIVNIIALGSSFLCGAFVPQEYLGSSVVNFSKVLPSYWFITNNNKIALLSNYTLDNILPIIFNMSIVLLFTLIFFIITNIVTKMKLKTN